MTSDSVLNLPDDVRMLDVVRKGLETATEVRIAVSFTRCSGLGLLIDSLKDVVSRSGKVRILTSTYQALTQPEALEALIRIPGIETRIQDGSVGFHAKFWWFEGHKGSECWAGSSNISKGGLASNIEWNVRQLEQNVIEQTREQFDKLWKRSDVLSLSKGFIDSYRQKYLQLVTSRPDFVIQPGTSQEKVAPNEAQKEALEKLRQLRADGARAAAVIAATGIGKTYLAAFDAIASNAKTILYVSHRLEHLSQAKKSFARIFSGNYSLGILGGGLDESNADIVFATVSSLNGSKKLLERDFDYLVIDEFHHAEARSYQILKTIMRKAFLLGITATPERQDGQDVLRWCDWNIAYEVRMPEAIDRGWLVPFHYFGIADETIDYMRIPWRKLDEIEDMLSVESRAVYVLENALERGFDGQKRATIGFCAGIKHARFMAQEFNKRGQCAEAVIGLQKVEDRERTYRRLADLEDPLEWVFVSDVLNEGVDIPVVNSVLFLRPTESATIFLQQLGRGLRLFPDTEVLTVLDFVGHHSSAWLTINALDSPSSGGRRTEITDGIVIKPPRDCEIVLQRRTREILSKVKRFTSTKKEACNHAYDRIREELKEPPLPVHLSNRIDSPSLSEFRSAYGSWINCQIARGNSPRWLQIETDQQLTLTFLKNLESDWQAPRVTPYAIIWGLAKYPDEPQKGYLEFFQRWPQWKKEQTEYDFSKVRENGKIKLGESLIGDRLNPQIIATLGPNLLPEVEGRVFYNINRNFQQRYGGTLRTPSDLNIFAQYNRPEIIRHFGTYYDPSIHNTGVIWISKHCVIISKLDTSTAKKEHQYVNQILDEKTFIWTSQNQMSQENKPGKKLINHFGKNNFIHIFLQKHSHDLAYYIGTGVILSLKGSCPMLVRFELSRPLPKDLLLELGSVTEPNQGEPGP